MFKKSYYKQQKKLVWLKASFVSFDTKFKSSFISDSIEI